MLHHVDREFGKFVQQFRLFTQLNNRCPCNCIHVYLLREITTTSDKGLAGSRFVAYGWKPVLGDSSRLAQTSAVVVQVVPVQVAPDPPSLLEARPPPCPQDDEDAYVAIGS